MPVSRLGMPRDFLVSVDIIVVGVVVVPVTEEDNEELLVGGWSIGEGDVG